MTTSPTYGQLATEGSIDVKPAAGVWTGPDPVDHAAQASFFAENGFLILRGALSAAEVAQLKRELDRLAENHATLPRIREGFDLEPRQDGSRKTPTFRKIGGISDMSDDFNKLLKHPRIIDALHRLMNNPRVYLHRDVVMMKPARVGREKPWHQDSVYWPWQPMALISAMTALDDAEPENGCMQVIPGTHREAVQHYGKELRIDVNAELQDQTVYVPLKAGDTLLFHSLLLHASEPNRSDRDRRVAIFSYMPGGLKYIGKASEPDPILVSQRD